MCKSINIPDVDSDERIGSVFNELFKITLWTDNQDSDRLSWNLTGSTFFHPFFLAPLVIYRQKCEKKVDLIMSENRIMDYLNLVHFETPLVFDNADDLKRILEPYTNKTFLPVCQFDLHKSNLDALQTIIQKIIKRQSEADNGISTPLSYFLGELIDNMIEHSDGKHGYIFSQFLKREGCIDLVLADDGITVYGSYADSKKYLDEIGDNEAEALRLANEGKSTKNLPDTENRGYGISSSRRMLVEGLHGSFFMLSGNAFHRHDSTGQEFVKLPKQILWPGTIILMKIPVKVPSDFDYSNYTK